MPTTRSRRYDDPVEEQPAEDPPFVVNQPPQKQKQKQRSNAARTSRRLAAKMNPSEKSKNSTTPARKRQTQKKKAAENTSPGRGKEDSTVPSSPEPEDPPLVRISNLAMAKPASFTPKFNLYRDIVGKKDKEQNDQQRIPVDASCAKKLNQLMAPPDLLGQLQRGSLTVPSVSVPVTTTATTTTTAPSVPVPVTTSTTPLTTSNTPSANSIDKEEEPNGQDNAGSFLGSIDVDGLGTSHHLFEQTATALPGSTGATIQTPAHYDSLLAMHQQQASRPSTGRFGSANAAAEIPLHQTPAHRRPKQTLAHRAHRHEASPRSLLQPAIAAENGNRHEASPRPSEKRKNIVRFQLPPSPESSERAPSSPDDEPNPIEQPLGIILFDHDFGRYLDPDDSSESEVSSSDEDPAPQNKPRQRLEFLSSDSDGDDDDDDDDSSKIDDSSKTDDKVNQQAPSLQASDEDPAPHNEPRQRLEFLSSDSDGDDDDYDSSKIDDSSKTDDKVNQQAPSLQASDEDPAPHNEPRQRLEFLSSDSDGDSDDDDYDSSKIDDSSKTDDMVNQQAPSLQAISEEETTINRIINLRCKKSVKASYPLQLQPPSSFLVSSDKLGEFMRMTKDQQWVKKKAFTRLLKKEQNVIKDSIPGSSCSCCKPTKRSRKGKKVDNSSKTDDKVNQQAPSLQAISEEETTIIRIINLRCKKSVKASYPLQLQPPSSFLVSSDKLGEFMRMTEDQQWVEKKAFTRLLKKEQNVIKDSIPGSSCSCCKPAKRSDKGKKRGKHTKTKRQSKRLRSENPPSPHQQGESTSTKSSATSVRRPATSARSPATSARSPATVVYNSLAHGEAARDAAPGEEKPKYKRQSKTKLQYASSVQMQGGETAMQEIMKVQRAMIKAITFSSREPTFDETSRTYKHDQRKEIPRVRGLLVFVNEVGETPMCGGNLPDGKLRREKAQISYVSTCKEDATYVLDIMRDAQADPNKCEKLKFMGSGLQGLATFDTYTNDRKRSRSKLGQQAQSIAESRIDAVAIPTEHP
jgi:hypothetical protein